MNQAVIGIGSNIRPKANIAKAIERIGESHRILNESRFVETAPVGGRDQPNYTNGAILIETNMRLEDLKASLRQLEAELGRTRSADRYDSRTIDLDIVVWDGEVVDRDVHEREFLKAAVLEVCPELNV